FAIDTCACRPRARPDAAAVKCVSQARAWICVLRERRCAVAARAALRTRFARGLAAWAARGDAAARDLRVLNRAHEYSPRDESLSLLHIVWWLAHLHRGALRRRDDSARGIESHGNGADAVMNQFKPEAALPSRIWTRLEKPLATAPTGCEPSSSR